METKSRHYGSLTFLGKEQGIVLPIALMVMLLLTVLGLGALLVSALDLLTTRGQKKGKEAFYAAEGGIVYGTKELDSLLTLTESPSTAQFDAIVAPSIPGFTFDEFDIAATGVATNVTITTGPYSGLNSISTSYTITVQASGIDSESGTVRLTQTLQDQLIPLFQFGVFYNDDLEIFPGPPLTFNGRIHSNKNIYIGGDATVDSRISSASSIFRCRKDNSSDCHSVDIKTPGGTYIGLSYDHTDPNWMPNAYSDWGGLVQDSAHGVRELKLPLGSIDPTVLIKKGDTIDPITSSESHALKDSRLYWQADIRILEDTAGNIKVYNRTGIDITATMPPGMITSANFYDYREMKTVSALQIDCNNLGSAAPANGILYVSRIQDTSGTLEGVRLTNCSTLPTGGLTVASNNPIYVKGNYNTTSKKGAAILGDTVTFLSNNWNDANAVDATSPFSNRVASNTTFYAAVVTGNNLTSVGQYNGGLENLARLLENWSGKTLTLSGSLINLWQSEQATGPSNYGSPIYTAPIRAWSYDTDFNDPAKLPPGTPHVRTLELAQWARE